jgi:hypothetical protein
LRMTAAMARPISGSASSQPSATPPALAITPRLTSASARACLPSAIRARAREAPAGPRPHPGGALVAEETHHAGERQREQAVQGPGVDQPLEV